MFVLFNDLSLKTFNSFFYVLKCCSVCMIYSVSMVNYCSCEKDCYFVLKNYFSVEIIFKYCKLKVQNQFKRTEGKDRKPRNGLVNETHRKNIEFVLNGYYNKKKVAGLCKTAANCFQWLVHLIWETVDLFLLQKVFCCGLQTLKYFH